MNEPGKLYPSQLNELCGALRWQGGTFYQVVAEVKRLRLLVDEVQSRDAASPAPTEEPIAPGAIKP